MKKRWFKRIFIVLGILVLIVTVNFIPTLYLRTNGMTKLDGKWIDVYYETEAEAAKDVFEYAEVETEAIAERLGFSKAPDVNVYIYDYQRTMQMKKYGFVAPLLGLDWYIGDNIGTDVILTSPANPGDVHTYDNNKHAVLHEIVHAYISVLNENNVVENTTAAESRIRDVDMAKEMVEFSKNMILDNVGQAMLTQANKNNEGLLSLLQ